MTVTEEVQAAIEPSMADSKVEVEGLSSGKDFQHAESEGRKSNSPKSETPKEEVANRSDPGDSVAGNSDCLSTAEAPEGASVCSTASEARPELSSTMLEVASERGIGSLPIASTELLFAAVESRQARPAADEDKDEDEDEALPSEDWEKSSQPADVDVHLDLPATTTGSQEELLHLEEDAPAAVPGSQECPSPLLPPHSSSKKPSIPSGSDDDDAAIPLSARSGKSVKSARSGRSLQAAPTPSLPSFTFTWTATGQGLDALLVPGDILAVNANQAAALSTRLFMGIGTTRGFMGHVMLVTAPPQCVKMDSSEGEFLEAAFNAAPEGVTELWKVRTVESSSSEKGLHQSDLMLFVDSKTNHLRIAGELSKSGSELSLSTDQERVDLWQSPACLRGNLKMDVMQKVLAEMQDSQADWSGQTAIRAVFTSATLTTPASGREAQMLADIRSSWLEPPICTSIVVTFWQRYLIMTSSTLVDQGLPDTALPRVLTDLILRYMPVKANASLPADLVAALENSGWVRMGQIPHLYRGAILASSPFPSQRPQPPAATLLRPSPSGAPSMKMTPAASATTAGPMMSARSIPAMAVPTMSMFDAKSAAAEFPEDPSAEVSV